MGKLSLTGYRSRGRLADLSTAVFDPVTSIPWFHLYYAGGPVFQALGLSNGASMTGVNWPDEIATNAFDLNAGTGTYRSADAAINSKPSIEMTGSGVNGKNHSTSGTAGQSLSRPFTVVVVVQLDTVAAGRYIHDGPNGGSGGSRLTLKASPFASSAWGWDGSDYSGTATAGTATTGIHAFREYVASSSALITLDGSTLISGSSWGTSQVWGGTTFGGESGAPMDGRCAFYGVYSGDITGHGQWSAFQAWVSSTYGVSIS